ncbi:hypothetical protein E2C01_038454 [Portunus trituberculatus]|uniref:Uncharacterized protein n=1 Tax=Portunus trituberculatus TaxID=210409 RepID=A0A5B7FK63_PORTR|nr:hypothetical protein [Portunus trituberculatus]
MSGGTGWDASKPCSYLVFVTSAWICVTGEMVGEMEEVVGKCMAAADRNLPSGVLCMTNKQRHESAACEL